MDSPQIPHRDAELLRGNGATTPTSFVRKIWRSIDQSRNVRLLVSCPRNTRYFVAIKMGRRQGGPSRTGGGGSISEPIRDRRATQPPAHFHRNPPGRGQLAVFSRCSLDPYDKDMGASPPVRLGPP